MWKEFRHPILFLIRFFVFYLTTNFIYGLYINSYDRVADPVTKVTTVHSAVVLRLVGTEVSVVPSATDPKVYLGNQERQVLSVYEGCNGVNVMIVFLAFIFSFTMPNRKMLWFVPMGLLFIYLINLFRIILLYFIAEHFPDYMYFLHKYFFTGIVYTFVFSLWYYWISKINVEQAPSHS